MKSVINSIIVVLLICTTKAALAGGAVFTGPTDNFWRPNTYPSQYTRPYDSDFTFFKVKNTSEKTIVTIKDKQVNTEIIQTYYSTFKEDTVTSYFLFPMPKHLNAKDLKILVDEEETRVRHYPIDKTAKVLEDMIRRTENERYMLYGNSNLYEVRLDSVMPASTHTIKVTYTHSLKNNNNNITEYTHPVGFKTITKPTKFDLAIQVQDKEDIQVYYAPEQQAKMERKNAKELALNLSHEDFDPQDAFTFYYATGTNQDVGAACFSHKTPNKDGYFFIKFDTEEVKDLTINKKDVTFIVDVSENMDGEKLVQTRKAIDEAIQGLRADDRFNIISYATNAKGLFKDFREATIENKAVAKTFLKELTTEGESNIEAALKTAMELTTKRSRPHLIFFVNAGEASVGIDDEDRLVNIVEFKNPINTRLFTIGVSEDCNTYFLDKLANFGKGERLYVTEEDKIAEHITSLYNKFSQPILTNMKLHFNEGFEVEDVFPKNVTDLYKGEMIIVGRYKKGGKQNLSLIGDINGELKRYRFDFELATSSENYSFIKRIWAARTIGYAFNQMRLEGDEDGLGEKVTDLAEQNAVITPYTAHFIMEKQEDELGADVLPRILNQEESIMNMYDRSFEILLEEISGKQSVRCSQEVGGLMYANYLSDICQGQHRMHYKLEDGKVYKDIGEQYGYLNDELIYRNNDGMWFVANKKVTTATDIETINFGSPAYYNLLTSAPKALTYIGLGKEILFPANNIVYEIVDDSKQLAEKK